MLSSSLLGPPCPIGQMQSQIDPMADAWQADKMQYDDAEATDAYEDDLVTPMDQISKTQSKRLSCYSQDDRQRGRWVSRSKTDVETDIADTADTGSSQGYRRSRQRSFMTSRSSLNAAKPPPRSHSVPWSHHRSSLRQVPQVPDSTSDSSSGSDEDLAEDEEADTESSSGRYSQSAPLPGRNLSAMKNSASRSSSGSTSTIIPSTFTNRGESPKPETRRNRLASSTISTRVSPSIVKVHDALRYLDEDSPAITEESIRRSVAEASVVWRVSSLSSKELNISPSAPNTSPGSSSFSSGVSGGSSDLIRDHESDRSSSPEQSINGGDTMNEEALRTSSNRASIITGTTEPKGRYRRRRPSHEQYGTPEMPRGNARLPHIPPKELKARPQSQSQAMHLPRAEKLPLSGYELLAARVSNTSPNDHGHVRSSRARRGSVGSSVSATSTAPSTPFQNYPPLKPIYRRFEALNHRLLLQLQDELSELEEQLHRLDTADTQTRRVQNQILPASRRAGSTAGGELQLHRTEVLAKIGYKLAQYNHVLTSFTETQKLPSPAADDVENYRTYLAERNPIAEIEARFLDSSDDLVSLAPSCPSSPRSSLRQQQHYGSHQPLSDGTLATMPAAGSFISHSTNKWSHRQEGCAQEDAIAQPREEDNTAASPVRGGETNGFKILVAAAAASVLVPVVTFPLLPSFMARVVVVFIMALTMLRLYSGDGKSGIALPSQARDIISDLSTRDIILTVGSYGAVMTVIAGII